MTSGIAAITCSNFKILIRKITAIHKEDHRMNCLNHQIMGQTCQNPKKGLKPSTLKNRGIMELSSVHLTAEDHTPHASTQEPLWLEMPDWSLLSNKAAFIFISVLFYWRTVFLCLDHCSSGPCSGTIAEIGRGLYSGYGMRDHWITFCYYVTKTWSTGRFDGDTT